ncbi:class I SAM-dependent methyltransferase [Paraliobacillus zengyii]|uniref:class I SAM-dependent methyltransferase n=1 Tax=Paraliobacillus zengyii TaxID=2213194 RepID=UPI000E3E22E3|nr:class I SAM-dependent methyltransferase [Paraliobacillus zengyii]
MDNIIGVKKAYWQGRKNMMYYQYVDFLVHAFASDARSIIDVGTANTQYIEDYYWIPEKYVLDIEKPYRSPNVTSVEMDFLEYEPENKFDFLTCLQVLEHIPKVEMFARKLLRVADRVLISVPYVWPERSEEEHIHDPIDLDKVTKWMGREPSYYIIVTEPLRHPNNRKTKRLICYYQKESINFGKVLSDVNGMIKGENNIKNEEDNMLKTKTLEEVKLEEMDNRLQSFLSEQNLSNEIFKLEIKNLQVESELNQLIKLNEKNYAKISEYDNEIVKLKQKITRTRKEKNNYKSNQNAIKQSRTWKYTSLLRKFRNKLTK